MITKFMQKSSKLFLIITILSCIIVLSSSAQIANFQYLLLYGDNDSTVKSLDYSLKKFGTGKIYGHKDEIKSGQTVYEELYKFYSQVLTDSNSIGLVYCVTKKYNFRILSEMESLTAKTYKNFYEKNKDFQDYLMKFPKLAIANTLNKSNNYVLKVDSSIITKRFAIPRFVVMLDYKIDTSIGLNRSGDAMWFFALGNKIIYKASSKNDVLHNRIITFLSSKKYFFVVSDLLNNLVNTSTDLHYLNPIFRKQETYQDQILYPLELTNFNLKVIKK
jgi:hypothetical protein